MQTYTFHVSLSGYGRLWRKLELPAEATLESLHDAIQTAYQFDNDHLYSFFMSGKAWDRESEYRLYEDEFDNDFSLFFGEPLDEEWDEEDEEWDEEAVAEEGGAEERPSDRQAPANFTSLAELPPSDTVPMPPDAELERPSPQQLRDMFAQLKDDPNAREEFMKGMAEQLGLPPLMAQMLLGNLDAFISNVSDDELEQVLNLDLDTLFDEDDEDDDDDMFDEEGDVRTTTLASLELKKGQKFLYLFDYGDEWRFTVKVHAINKNADPSLTYPRIVESVGEAPVQYAGWDEEDWDEDDEDGADGEAGDGDGE
ncbi:MAG TPA: hypothetical protein P5121_22865 [Caldilineaceae bacterium]|nr:hypothetical protein [Caldilineaceae bacterium]